MNEKRARSSTLLESSQKACGSEPNRCTKACSESYRRSSRLTSSESRGRDALWREPLVGAGRPAAPGARDRRRPVRADVARGQVAEVDEQAPPERGADRLRVELHPVERVRAVRDAHDDAVAGPRQRLEVGRQRLGDAERVVADRLELLGDAGEQRRALVADDADPSVHDLGRVHDVAARQEADALMAEAHAEQRYVGRGDGVGADAEVLRLVGPAGPGREHDVVVVPLGELRPRGAVVAHHERLVAVGLRQQLEEVVGERVVVVDQQCLHVRPGTCGGPCRADCGGSRRGTPPSSAP